MEDNKSTIKYYSFTYGKVIYISFLAFAGLCFFLSIFLLPNAEGIAMLLIGFLFILLSFCLLRFKYMNYITLTENNVSTKKQIFSWEEVHITMSYYFTHHGTSRMDYYIFFDDHYLSKEEMYSRRVKRDAFYIMATPKRLEVILQKYNKKIELIDRCGIDRKHLYDKINEYNLSLEKKQDNQ